MSENFQTFRLSDIPRLTKEEMDKAIQDKKEIYRLRLAQLGATDAQMKKAKTISSKKTSCTKCVYNGDDGFSCWCPYSDATMETLGINPCYEGVLKYIVKKDKGAV